ATETSRWTRPARCACSARCSPCWSRRTGPAGSRERSRGPAPWRHCPGRRGAARGGGRTHAASARLGRPMTVLVGASRVCTRKRRVITAPTPYEEESAMVVLGLVLLVGAGVFAASVISSNTGAVGGDLWGLHISNVTVGEVFVAGLAAGAVALLGLVMMLAG